MRDLVLFLASPIGLVFLMLVACFLSAAKLKATRLSVLIAATTLCLYIFSLPIVSAALIRSLESQHPNVSDTSKLHFDVLIVLGGGLALPHTGYPRIQLNVSSDRLLLAYEIFREKRVDNILLTGGSRFPPNDTAKSVRNWQEACPQFLDAHTVYGECANKNEAFAAKDLLIAWGIDEQSITTEPDSIDTRENIEFSQQIIQDWISKQHIPPTAKIGLITSAIHMPRAMLVAEKHGLQVTAVTARYIIAPDSTKQTLLFKDFIPTGISLGGSSRAIREYVGILREYTPL